MQNHLTIIKKIDFRLLKKSLFYTYLLGILAHGYCFFNVLFSHDALNNLYISEKWSKAGFGRFVYPIYISITRGRILLPWLIGFLGLLWTALAVYLILRMFQIYRTGAVVAISAIAVTNPTVYALVATYLHDFDADLFAFFLSVVSVYCWNAGVEETNIRKKAYFFTGGALVLSLALGIYQSYLSVTIVLIMLLSIQRLLNGKNWKKIVFSGVQGMFLLILSAVFYLCEIFVFSGMTGIKILENHSYNGLGNMETLFATNFFGKVAGAYVDFIESFLEINSLFPGRFYLIVHGVLAVGMIGLLLWGIRKVQLQNKILILILGGLLPLAMNLSYVLSGEMVHDIMKYAFWLIYLVVLLLIAWLDKQKDVSDDIKNIVRCLFAGCILIIILGNIQTSNAIYLKKDLEYQSTLSYMTRVAQKIEEQEEYVAGETPVLFVGEEAIGNSMSGFERFEDITGVGSSSPITFYETYEKYFKYVLNLPLNLWEDQTVAEKECVAKMPVFPKEGSIQMVDGVLVVKLK